MTTGDGSLARYPIRAVARLTGIGIDTLRAWERRYGAVVPVRDDRGRLYTEADVERLRLIQQAANAGHSVGRVARLSNAELRELAPRAAAVRTAPVAGGVDTSVLKHALEQLDGTALDQEFSRLASTLPPLALVQDVLLPMLREVGDRWNHRRGGIVHERLISSTMRNLLGSFLRLHSRSDDPVALLMATPSGERHEIGILSAAMLAASRGVRVSYLGPDLPADEILEAVRHSPAQALVLGLTFADGLPAAETELQTIVRGLPRRMELWVGGAATARVVSLLEGRALVLNSFDEYLSQVARLQDRGTP